VSTAWTEDEYARIATALLYPAYRRVQITYGHQLDNSYEYALNAKLEAMPERGKEGALALADQIQELEADLIRSTTNGEGVRKVDRIEFFTLAEQRAERERNLERTRMRLSALIDHPVNPTPGLTTAGGINASVCG